MSFSFFFVTGRLQGLQLPLFRLFCELNIVEQLAEIKNVVRVFVPIRLFSRVDWSGGVVN